ncbi:hypothetical protein CR513_44186, partial [Mucuna pruriens]
MCYSPMRQQWLNRVIQDIVELYHYATMDDLVHQAIRVEAQQKRHLTSRKSYPNSPSNWKGKEKRKEMPIKGKSPKKGVPCPKVEKRRVRCLVYNIKCIKCLGKGHTVSQCPNKRSMIMQEDGTVDNDSPRIDSLSISDSYASNVYLPDEEGDLLMVRWERMMTQRENVFHSRCNVVGQLCSIIIDGGININVASLRLVEKLKLPTLAHPKP